MGKRVRTFTVAKCLTLLSLLVLGSCSFLRNSREVAPFQVVISEINYHDALDREENDFIELWNTGDTKVAVTGWCIRGVEFCFKEKTVLEGLAYVTVRSSEFAGSLSNSGETLVLVDAQDNVRDTVTYGSTAPWPVTADGNGYSLHRVVGAAPADAPTEWEAAEPTPNAKLTPRAEMSARPRASVAINEVNYHPTNDDPSQEFIELVNVTTSSVDLSGWCIPDIAFCISSQRIEAGGVAVVRPRLSNDTLSNGGQKIRLVDASGVLVDIAPIEDSGEWPARADGSGHSLQRRDPLLSGVEPGNWLSAEPSPGVANSVSGRGYIPAFFGVTHTSSPSPGQSIRVTTSLRDGDSPSLVYRIGFGKEKRLPMASTSGVYVAEIPPQSAGSLVRYRLVARNSAGVGQWPRQGDGSRYSGTVVKDTAESKLPELKWFIPDATYDKAYADTAEFGDDGYASVFAFDGVVMDNAVIRVKGQQSRRNQKRKWKVALPAGHQWDMSGRLRNPVNEFSLHSAVTDKSFVREILTSDLQELSGGMAQQVFPIRLTKNNDFYGLYLYVEQPDGVWRSKYGFSSETRVFKGERIATLRADHVNLPKDEFALRYQQKTQLYTDTHDTLRALIRSVTNPDEKKVIAFAYRHLDIPQIINAIATMKVAQHLEWEHKNYQVYYDPSDEKWRLVPVDFDLNFGRRYRPVCKSLCDEVAATAYPEYFSANRLGRVFFRIPQFREMLDRRTKSLADLFYAGTNVEKRIAELAALMDEDAKLDRRRWYTYGIQQTMREGQELLIKNFLLPKREMFTGENPSHLPASQEPKVSYTVSGTNPVVVTSTDTVAIDLSGVEVAGVDGKIPSGTVLLPKQSAVLSNERTKAPPADGRLYVWVPAT